LFLEEKSKFVKKKISWNRRFPTRTMENLDITIFILKTREIRTEKAMPRFSTTGF